MLIARAPGAGERSVKLALTQEGASHLHHAALARCPARRADLGQLARPWPGPTVVGGLARGATCSWRTRTRSPAPPPADPRDPVRRRGQNALLRRRRDLAMAQGHRRQIPLPLLGAGDPLDDPKAFQRGGPALPADLAARSATSTRRSRSRPTASTATAIRSRTPMFRC